MLTLTNNTLPVNSYRNISCQNSSSGCSVSFCAKNRLITPTNTNLQKSLGEENIKLLDGIRKVGKEHGLDTYLVGGAVRDSLLSKRARDLDVMVNGNALEFSKMLKAERPDLAKRIFLKPSVGRAVVQTKDMLIDVVPLCQDGISRTDKSGLKKALLKNTQHRDYTVNAMFIHLGEDNNGKIKLKLIDKVGGKRDLRENVLKGVNLDNFESNHVQSMRGIRFIKKYDMKADADTLDTLKHCFEKSGKRNLGYYIRFVREFKRIFSLSKNPVSTLKTLKKYNFFKMFHK